MNLISLGHESFGSGPLPLAALWLGLPAFRLFILNNVPEPISRIFYGKETHKTCVFVPGREKKKPNQDKHE